MIDEDSPLLTGNLEVGELAMLHVAVGFFIVALVAALLGFTGLAAGATGIATILFVLFAVLVVGGYLYNLIKK